MKAPQLKSKIYSFKDPMFESFGNKHDQDISKKISVNNFQKQACDQNSSN